MELSLGFDNIAIKQKKNICKSRSDVDIRSEIIRGVRVDIPLIAANMSTVINKDFYIKIHKFGAFAVMHRAIDHEELCEDLHQISKECDWVAASIGISNDDFDFIHQKLIRHGVNIIFIDVAHGYCDKVIFLAKQIKKSFSHVKVVVGNTVNIGLMEECADFVDAIKVGVGSGLVCETAYTAGCTERQFSAVLKFKKKAKKLGMPIISDGGIRQPGDFTKAIAAGASSVMAGSIFARCPESAAKIISHFGGQATDKVKKVYSGMASRQVQEKWRGKVNNGCPEGKTILLDIGEDVEFLLERYAGALRSGISYAGCDLIKDFHDSVEFVRLI
jgi:IMP dehydrogenase/GMP reductase